MKLQLALDSTSLEEALSILQSVHQHIDVIEVGTPFVLRYGMEAVRKIKALYPTHEVLCDGKIMDAGAFESEEMLDAGADWVTVMAFTDDSTIAECVETAHRYQRFVMADLLCIQDIPGRAKVLESLGVDCIAVHTGVDQQKLGKTPLQDLQILKSSVSCAKTAVAGGISLSTLPEYLKLQPDILIVGSGILSQPDITSTALSFKEQMLSFAKAQK